jgi:hypothetical protein
MHERSLLTQQKDSPSLSRGKLIQSFGHTLAECAR